ncbi:MAG: hypothetical protein J6T58_06850 [Bacteroidales bacterium]|nr:hypothetical protein [Bacteroidales bacterium]
MKPLKHTIWLALLALLLTACTPIEPGSTSDRPNSTSLDIYRLNISFKDQNGRDLLEQFASYKVDPTSPKYFGMVDPERYTLTIASTTMFPQDTSYFTLAKFDNLHSWMRTDKNGYYSNNRGTWYFSNEFIIRSKNNGSPYSPLRYYIFCRELFGDSIAYEIVTWWEEGTKDETNGQHYPKCIRATFEGKEIQPIQGISFNEKAEPYYVGYFLDIVLKK